MGADFCLAYLGIEKEKDPDWSKARELVERMGKTHLFRWKETFKDIEDMDYFFMTLDVPMGWKDEGEPDMNDRTRACERLLRCLREVRSAWDEGTRDSAVLELNGKAYLFSGGMSWGDPPTDTYSEINLFLASGMSTAAGFTS